MKIKIISIHDIGINYGSTLQACALYDFIKMNGYTDVRVINYKPSYSFHYGKCGQFIKKMLFFKEVKVQNKRFKEYYQEHCNLTEEYFDKEMLKSEKDGDVFIVGSDQVWNEFYDAGKDESYYLKFTDCKNKMSYGASVGQLQSDEAIARLKSKISDFKFVSVREQASVRQLEDAGVENVVHVLDPIFLHDREHYISSGYTNKYGKYVLVYVVHSDPFMDRMVTDIAKRLNAKIVLVGGFIQKIHHDYYLRDIGPSEFVNLINNAAFVVANSFHATAFSILLNKQFALVNPKASPLRLSDILETAGIQDRIISCENDLDKVFNEIEYISVNERIKRKQLKSREYLLNCLKYFNDEVKNEKK